MLTTEDKMLRMDLEDFSRKFVLEVSNHLIYAHPVESDEEALAVREALTLQGRKFMQVVYCEIASVKGLVSAMTTNDKKAYCTQNNGDCSTCSLKNYGRDCHNNKI